MVKRDKLLSYLHEFLGVKKTKDACPNGLQVEGKTEISFVVTSVSGSVDLFERAALRKADAVLVHHGIIWDQQDPVIRGSLRERISVLLKHNINLLGYHLPLDCHPGIGNNILAAKGLGLANIRPFGEYHGQVIGFCGRLRKKTPAKAFFRKVRDFYGSPCQIIPGGPEEISTIGIVSGGAQWNVSDAVREKLDVFITGEISESVVQLARESGLHFISAGHYATERLGIRALGEHIRKKFKIRVEYIDIPVPV